MDLQPPPPEDRLLRRLLVPTVVLLLAIIAFEGYLLLRHHGGNTASPRSTATPAPTATTIPALSSPKAIFGLVLWLDASELTHEVFGENIPSWRDLSGSGARVEQSHSHLQPQYSTLDERPSVSDVIQGSMGITGLPRLSTGESSLFIVGKADVPALKIEPEHIVELGRYPNVMGIVASGGELEGFQAGTYWAWGFPIPQHTAAFGMVNDMAGKAHREGSGVSAYFNGSRGFRVENLGSTRLSTYHITSGTVFNYRSDRRSGFQFQGDLQAVLLYDRALTDTEATRVMGYLEHRYRLHFGRPTENLVFDGDSLTAGGMGGAQPNGYVDLVLRDDPRTFQMHNLGVQGEEIASMTAAAHARVDPLYDTRVRRNVVVIWGGTNDLSNGRSVTEVYHDLVSYCRGRRARGYNVVVLTLLPRGKDKRFEAEREELNAKIRATWHRFADGLADVGNDPTIGSPGAQKNQRYYRIDNTHLTAAGYAIVAQHVEAVLHTVKAR
jgi:lysophospholipase L1-like esterase